MSATAFNQLIDGYVESPYPGQPPFDNNAGATMGASSGPNLTGTAAASLSVGSSPLTGPHNTVLHVAFLGLLALAVLVLLRKAGFRFSYTGRIGRG